MTINKQNLTGLSTAQAQQRQKQYGKNELTPPEKKTFIRKALHVLCEPMFLLLIIAAIIYFILGEPRDGLIMLIFVLSIISIDIIQEWKTDKTLHALKDLSAPQITVIRDGAETKISSIELVPGDLMLIHEGVKIPADGIIVECNDFCVDESSLTGEAECIWKTCTAKNLPLDGNRWRHDRCYAGTLVVQGSAVISVEKTGAATEYGKIGMCAALAPNENTPLKKQTTHLVTICSIIAGILFILAGILTYFNISHIPFYDRLITSILSGVTLAMAMIPEEFPVVLTVFLSMGAWRLAKKQSLIRRLPAVETLGAVSVLCVDKTGTITLNKMTVQYAWTLDDDTPALCNVMGLACETDAYDPMEKAMLSYCDKLGISKKQLFDGELVTEYAFTNELKMMGHVWRKSDKLILAAKGSPEQILSVCSISDHDKMIIQHKITALSKEGLRVIAVGMMNLYTETDIPARLTDCTLTFCGLIGLSDPPRPNIERDIALCSKAGIRIVMITGDNGITAASIAEKIGIQNSSQIVTGEMLDSMTEKELHEKVQKVNIFSRVVPEHKMRIVKALKENGEIVAMTGDGVNDAPALKYADIGIAMGKHGSEVSREAADLILMDDNFTTIIETVKDGRRIYDNIRKTVGYIFTIHIPIALSSLLGPLIGIAPSALLFLPLHIVLMELIIDPTCSIVLERQPAETGIMERCPRSPHEPLLSRTLLVKSILQGLTIFTASFGLYTMMLAKGDLFIPQARSMGLTVIMLANLFLVQVNSSDYDYIFHSIKRLIKDRVMWAINIFTLIGLFVILYTPLHSFLKLAPLCIYELFLSAGTAAVSVLWYEGVKLIRHSIYAKKHGMKIHK